MSESNTRKRSREKTLNDRIDTAFGALVRMLDEKWVSEGRRYRGKKHLDGCLNSANEFVKLWQKWRDDERK